MTYFWCKIIVKLCLHSSTQLLIPFIYTKINRETLFIFELRWADFPSFSQPFFHRKFKIKFITWLSNFYWNTFFFNFTFSNLFLVIFCFQFFFFHSALSDCFAQEFVRPWKSNDKSIFEVECRIHKSFRLTYVTFKNLVSWQIYGDNE